MAEFVRYIDGCEVIIEREKKRDNWYIIVTFSDGTRGYDGWWPESGYKSKDEAFAEACTGAQIDPTKITKRWEIGNG